MGTEVGKETGAMGNVQYTNGDGSYATDAQGTSSAHVVVSREEWDVLRKQVSEMHAFIEGIGQALQSPMLRALVPVEMQKMIPKNGK